MHRKRSRAERVGTLGCVVRIDGRRCILTCGHVIRGAAPADLVREMSRLAEEPPRNAAGAASRTRGSGWRPRRALGVISDARASVDPQVDCGIVRILPGARVTSAFPSPIGRLQGEPLGVEDLEISRGGARARSTGVGLDVRICGAASGRSSGLATLGYETDMVLDRKGRPRIAPPFIEIRSAFRETFDFCRKGDSGAIVMTDAPGKPARPIGLLVAKGPLQEPVGAVGYAVPIQRVLASLGSDARIE